MSNSPSEALKKPQKVHYKPFNVSDAETFGFDSNPTVFGEILRGELKMGYIRETYNLVAFEDIHPRAPLHGLIIPKQHIRSVLELSSATDGDEEAQQQPKNHNTSIKLLEEMSDLARALVRDKHPEAYEKGDYRLCFHIPPFYSVDHLHLHVLAPVSAMAPIYQYGKYRTGVRWCIGMDTVMDCLHRGLPPTPYSRNDSWRAVVCDLVESIKLILASSSS
eukprot:CAMPEP_0194189470 /NCGR_PEP_ID=MMETSP0154-20130528/59172_1 /TAXON_ID=1049557 /ORGANISM="Thalassiothrix antarctica, Strain L6-D1" /LENGTH=219 /DNA_ID=CAMNT_0038910653 /DNA_START=258 /DNA_END=914 /DNA_ORIENTATION=+